MTKFCLLLAFVLSLTSTSVNARTRTIYGNLVPGTAAVTNDTAAVNLGLKFTVNQPGIIQGVRFYRGVSNLIGYSIRLYDSTGQWLSQIHVYDSNVPGWQLGYFTTPVHIDAHKTYTVAYWTTNGQYAEDIGGLGSNFCNQLLACALANGGVFAYGIKQFPNQSSLSSNYWVDIQYWPDAMNIILTESNPTVPCNAAPGTVVVSFSDIGGNNNPITWSLNQNSDFIVSGTDILVGPNGIAQTHCNTNQTVALTATQQ